MKPQGAPITPAGMAALKARYDHLLGTERPAIVEIVSWAAGNGDRSENGDYLYGRKKMREIDRELAHLARRMKALRVVAAGTARHGFATRQGRSCRSCVGRACSGRSRCGPFRLRPPIPEPGRGRHGRGCKRRENGVGHRLSDVDFFAVPRPC